MLFETQEIRNSIAKMSTAPLFSVAASSAGSTRRRDGSFKTPNVFFGQMAAILPRKVDCLRQQNVFESVTRILVRALLLLPSADEFPFVFCV